MSVSIEAYFRIFSAEVHLALMYALLPV